MASPGAELKKIRLEKGISLEEVQKKTKIHFNILKAIEGDSLTDLNPVYLKGFLKIYCNFLGVDPKDYILDYKEPQAPTAKVTVVKEEPQSLKKTISFFKAFPQKLGVLKVYAKKIKAAFIFVIIVVFISLVFFNLGKFISSKRKAHLARKNYVSTQTPRPIQRRAVEKPAHTKTAPKITPTYAIPPTLPPPVAVLPVATVETKAQVKEINTGIRLGVRARENCWLFVKIDGKVVFQRILEKGRFESWQAKDKIDLSVGNAGVLELEVNGRVFSNLGRKGQSLKNIVITKDSLNIVR